MNRRIAVLCAAWLLSLPCANGQGLVTNSHSVEAIRTALSSDIPAQIQQQAQQYDAQLFRSRQSQGQSITFVTDARQDRVARIVEKLLAASGDSSQWSVRVLDSNPKIENAYTVGGRYIYVYTGLINNVQGDDELAFILGHEISHSRLKHNLRSSEDFSNLLGSIIELGGALSKSENRRDNMALVGGSIKALYSREDEREADALGAYIAKQANYNPALGVTFFNRTMDREKLANAQNDAQIAQAQANVQQQVANCEQLRAQWNSQPRIRTPQNAQILNSACQAAQANAQRTNSAVRQYTLGSVLLRTHPLDSDRISALRASVLYLQGSRTLQSLTNVGQGYNVFVALGDIASLNQSIGATSAPEQRSNSDAQGFYVALDAFSSDINAKALRTKLSAAGIRSVTEPVQASRGLTRVLAGPFTSQDEAERVRVKLFGMKLNPGAVSSK